MNTEPTTPAPAEPNDPCNCRTNPVLTAQIGYPVRCPHCPPGTSAVPPTHWTKHVQRHHPDAAVLPVPSAPTTDRAALDARVTEARDRLRGMALSLATATGPLVEPDMFADALDEYRDALLAAYDTTMRAAVLREAASAIEAEQAREEATEWAQYDELDHDTELQGAAVRASAGLLRRLAAGAQQPTRCTCTHTRSMHTGPNLFCAVPAQCTQYAGAQQQPTTETQPPRYRWRVETRDGVADEWAPGSAYLNRHHAVERYEALTEHHPTRKDGTPVERRIVRETTTYTVEEPARRPPMDPVHILGIDANEPAPVSAAETADQIATDLRNAGWHDRALGAEDVAAVLHAGERLNRQSGEQR